jgi:hypothetical protein
VSNIRQNWEVSCHKVKALPEGVPSVIDHADTVIAITVSAWSSDRETSSTRSVFAIYIIYTLSDIHKLCDDSNALLTLLLCSNFSAANSVIL